ncbi:hypothetical protein, partial [Streptomyces sp. NPDC057386]|uniref:hypothetical protein n=1 Tax=unclassified Streptomyces TaxID=2593676 RepID=UPI00362F6B59
MAGASGDRVLLTKRSGPHVELRGVAIGLDVDRPDEFQGQHFWVTPLTGALARLAQESLDVVSVGESAVADEGCGYADEGQEVFGLSLV